MLDTQEMIAATLQGRMSWPDAERCAAALMQAGGPVLDREQAIEALKGQLPPSHVDGAVFDLVMAGYVHREDAGGARRG